MDNKFLSYSQSGTKPESSNFDGTIQNLYTSNFGGLTPVFVKPVLADDHFKISLNSEVKVSTLNAPAYTNIKQNFYSFFVANQQVWKHWNSFITNGTEFQGVYGSNLNNQDLSNAWKIPSIRVNDLQFMTKVAKGFAIPVFSVDINSNETIPPFFTKCGIETASDSERTVFYVNTNITVNSSSDENFTTTSGMDLSPLFVNIMSCKSEYWRSLIKYVPYIYVHNLHIGVIQSKLVMTFDSIDFGCAIDDFDLIFSILFNSTSVLSPDITDDNRFDVNSEVQFIRYRLFCDETSHDVNVNESPFAVDYVRKDVLTGSLSLNGIRYRRKYTQNSDYVSTSPIFPAANTQVLQTIKYVKLSQFWQKELTTYKGVDASSSAEILRLRLSDVGGFIDLDASSDFATKYIALFESDEFYPESRFENKTILCGESSFNVINNFSGTRPISSNFTTIYKDELDRTQVNKSNPDPSNIVAYDFKFLFPACDILFPFYTNVYDRVDIDGEYCVHPYAVHKLHSDSYASFSYIPLLDTSALNNRMTISAFMFYLCNSVLKTLDYVNVPYEGFTIRDFSSYALEVINALPFMSISRIWDEYFKNRTVSAPELNFCEVNYSAFCNKEIIDYMKNHSTNEQKENSYFDFTKDDNLLNSWCIPFDVLPKNGLKNIISNELDSFVIQGLNEFHYFNITCFGDLFSLLSGFQLNHCVLHQVMHPLKSLDLIEDNSSCTVIYGALLNRFVLPEFYNGLLHYKFQNFSKDYFSSALLDAMSGANQEEIPDTVTELRSSEARQSFWEQTAVARSIKKFFQKMFGTNPTHVDQKRPILLGQSHNKISIGEIIQTSGTVEDGTPQGTRTGIGGGHAVNGICNHGFNEQGWLIILSSITLDAQYYQGLNKSLVPYRSYLDYPFRNFYHIGNQSINMREVSFISNPKYPHHLPRFSNGFGKFDFDSPYNSYSLSTISNNVKIATRDEYNGFDINPNCCMDTDSNFDSVFGYIPRFSEYKFNFDELHGDFRTSLMSWNTFRKFHTMPYLTHNFVNWEFSGVNYDLNRLFAVMDDSDKFICSLYVNVQMHRQIPYYSIPKSATN